MVDEGHQTGPHCHKGVNAAVEDGLNHLNEQWVLEWWDVHCGRVGGA